MVNEAYGVGKELIPFYLLGTILSTISSFLGNTFSAIKKNQLLFITMLIGSVANVVCIHLLLPKLGLQASNVALAIGFLLICITRLVLLKKELHISIEYRNIVIVIIGFICVTIAYQYGNLWQNIVVMLVALALIFYFFKDVFHMVLQKVRGRD